MPADTWSWMTAVAAVLALIAFMFLWSAVGALRRARFLKLAGTLTFGLLLLAVAVLLGTLALATQGYRALTKEDVAALVEIEPEAPQRFRVRLRTADGSAREFRLAGDEFYIDAHILKWKPFANIVGLHTAYELDRVAGRYRRVADERGGLRTVHGLSEHRPVDLFALRQRYALLAPLLDAEYGSATYVPADQRQVLEVRVSTSGLLIRPVEPGR